MGTAMLIVAVVHVLLKQSARSRQVKKDFDKVLLQRERALEIKPSRRPLHAWTIKRTSVSKVHVGAGEILGPKTGLLCHDFGTYMYVQSYPLTQTRAGGAYCCGFVHPSDSGPA